MHRLALHDGGPREPVVHRSGLALVEELAHQHVDRAAVLRVHHDQRARLPRLAHRAEDRRVVEHEHAGVGHEELERRDALPDQLVHLLQDLVVHLADDHVEAVVGDGVLRLREPAIETLSQPLAVVLQREVDDRRGAAERGRAGPRLEVVRAEAAAERQLHVRVHVDAAGHHVAPGRVDHAVRVDGHARADRRDLLVLDHDVGLGGLGRRDDGPPLDQRPHAARLLSFWPQSVSFSRSRRAMVSRSRSASSGICSDISARSSAESATTRTWPTATTDAQRRSSFSSARSPTISPGPSVAIDSPSRDDLDRAVLDHEHVVAASSPVRTAARRRRTLPHGPNA